jgi:hypothetical protein
MYIFVQFDEPYYMDFNLLAHLSGKRNGLAGQSTGFPEDNRIAHEH